ncbi:MAG: hypothetical protein ABSC47_01255 [Terracidiphilus sp.]|jgi:hypothetical protein
MNNIQDAGTMRKCAHEPYCSPEEISPESSLDEVLDNRPNPEQVYALVELNALIE